MKAHKKPTAQELEAGIKQAQEQLENIDKKDEKTTEETIKKADEVTKESETAEEAPETKDESTEEESKESGDEGSQEAEKEPEEPQPSPEVDYKKKFVSSTREAQVLHSQNKRINEALDKALALPEPTDDEIAKEYTDWDVMSDTEKKLARKTYRAERALAVLNEVTKESKDIAAWNSKVDTFVTDPKTLNEYPLLDGKVEDFKIFAGKPTRRGADFADLVSAFLFEAEKARPKNKGKMFETGTGGPSEKEKPKSDKISVLDARRLMKTDYKRYKSLLIAGKIESE